MAIYSATNISVLQTRNYASQSTNAVSTAMEKLSSGLRINSAKDDAAGLQLSNRFTKEVSGLAQANRNAADAISLAQVAEGALANNGDILFHIRDLVLRAESGALSQNDRHAIQQEIDAYVEEFYQIKQTSFGDKKLFDGTFGTVSMQVGSESFSAMDISLPSFDEKVFKSESGIEQFDLDRYKGLSPPIPDTEIVIILDISGSMDNTLENAKNAVSDLLYEYSANTVSNTRVGLILYGPTPPATHAVLPLTEINAAGTETIENFIPLVTNGGQEQLHTAFGEASTLFSADTGGNREVVIIASKGDEIVNNAGIRAAGLAAAQSLIDNDITVSSIQVNQSHPDSMNYLESIQALPGNDGTLNKSHDGSDIGSILSDKFESIAAEGVEIGSALSGLRDIDVTERTENAVTIGLTPVWLDVVDSALTKIDSARAHLGAVMNRLNSVINVNSISGENILASRSRIVDTDFAKQTAELTKQQIFQQASSSLLAQANQMSDTALDLLG